MTRPRFRNLLDLLQARASAPGQRPGYRFLADGEHECARLSYHELDAAARALGAMLDARVAPRSNVILAYPPGLEFIVGFFGCLYAGLVPVPVCPPHPRKGHDRLAAIAADCGAKQLMTSVAGARLFAAAVANGGSLAHLDVIATDHGIGASPGAHETPPLSAASVAFLQYTSGSTRAPRGVRVTHANVLANLAAIHAAEGNDADSRGVSWLPAYHDMGLIEGVLQPLYGGFPTWLMPHTAFLQRPARWLHAVSRHEATVSGGPNFAFDACVRRIPDEALAALDLARWRVAYCGAEPVRAETLRAFSRRFERCGFRRSALRPVYGLAEATLLVTASNPDVPAPRIAHADRGALERGSFVAVPKDSERGKALVSCGAPGAGVGVAVLDPETNAPLPEGAVGEIWVSGPSVAAGYHLRPASSREAFCDLRLGGTDARWLRTGDLGFLSGGELYVTGRSKDVIILHGRKLHPQDIEHTVERLGAPRVEGVAAFAVQGAADEGVVVLAELQGLHRAAPASASMCGPYADAIRTEIYRQHEVSIAALAFLPPGALARTSSGKLMRFRCKQDFVNAQLPLIARFDAPSGGAGRIA